MGLNMPARTVLFTNARKFDGKDFRWVTYFNIYGLHAFIFRVASESRISGNLEKSGNFVALEKSQGIL